MMSMVQVWVSLGDPVQDVVVEGPFSSCSVRLLSGVKWEALATPVEMKVYRGGEHDSR
jgi:hypothetical protein